MPGETQSLSSPSASPLAPPDLASGWSKSDVSSVQTELQRLGLYRLKLDGLLGPGTRTALVEAFAGNGWSSLTAEAAQSSLAAASPPAGPAGEHRPLYGAMFQDGVLDITLGVGFDEMGAHRFLIPAVAKLLAERGFVPDPAGAAELYRQAGRTLDADAYGSLYVLMNALQFPVPAGGTLPVHAVVRLVFDTDGTRGASAAAAFRDGLLYSDLAHYAGHARYGSGPDFDPNMTYALLDESGAQVGDTLTDYAVLEKLLTDEGAPSGRDAWAQFQWRVENNRIRVTGFNEGNVYLNSIDYHASEFGGKLMYWNLTRSGGLGGALATGAAGVLAQVDARRYHLWSFDGCRTDDYVKSIRQTPGLDVRHVDLLVMHVITYWNDKAAVMGALLDDLLALRTYETLRRDMDAACVTAGAGSDVVTVDGIENKPVIV